ncbi:LOW QUALITY PROTEIN: hypothetical protein Cgig2_028156 [Carnegiea gigantea]|uniref:Uncharacterized protein n=1 Tax=Carnegiea gigantea TaxID=171969 RepID=A0A9Q1JZM4_9CARY|nr:LOW QUALITY PROTEIN: hypothetical protein Cgig2_028156 [Carnegiea gigantea]
MEMTVASAIIRRIIIETKSSVDVITWDCLTELKYRGTKFIPWHIPSWVLEVNPTGMIRLPLCFKDKAKVRNLEVDFFVVGNPTAYNVILGGQLCIWGRLQFEADDGSVGKLQGDQRMARECYPINIRPLVEQSAERGPVLPLPPDKKPHTVPPPPVKVLAMHTLASTEFELPRLEAVDGIEEIPQDKECPKHTVQLG